MFHQFRSQHKLWSETKSRSSLIQKQAQPVDGERSGACLFLAAVEADSGSSAPGTGGVRLAGHVRPVPAREGGAPDNSRALPLLRPRRSLFSGVSGNRTRSRLQQITHQSNDPLPARETDVRLTPMFCAFSRFSFVFLLRFSSLYGGCSGRFHFFDKHSPVGLVPSACSTLSRTLFPRFSLLLPHYTG